MPQLALASSAYPKDKSNLPTLVHIGTYDFLYGPKNVETDSMINRHLGCITHTVVTDELNDQNGIIRYSPSLSYQLDAIDQSSINSVKISLVSDIQSVGLVHQFISSTTKNPCRIIVDLLNDQWVYEVLQAVFNLILPLSSVLVITLNVARSIFGDDQHNIEAIAHRLLGSGPKVVLIKDESERWYIAMICNESCMKTTCFWLPGQVSSLKADFFSTAIAAYLAHNHLPLEFAISYGHAYSVANESTRSYFTLVPPLSFTQELWASVDDIYNRILELPFLKKMLDSTLDERIFNYYIVQDYLFFLDRGRMLKGLVSQCSDGEAHTFLNGLLDKNDKYISTLLVDNNLDPLNVKATFKTPACTNYTAYMLSLALCHDTFGWIKGLLALLPCNLVYAKVGDWMITTGLKPTVKRYAEFIDYYRNQSRRDRLVYFLELTNRVVNDLSFQQRYELKHIFRQVCEYEHDFWVDSYLYGKKEIDDGYN